MRNLGLRQAWCLVGRALTPLRYLQRFRRDLRGFVPCLGVTVVCLFVFEFVFIATTKDTINK